MAHAQALAYVGGGRLAADAREQRVEVQRRRAVVVAEARRPLVARAVGRELDAVAIRICEVDRLVRTVVGRALDAVPVAARRTAARASSSRLGYSSAKW